MAVAARFVQPVAGDGESMKLQVLHGLVVWSTTAAAVLACGGKSAVDVDVVNTPQPAPEPAPAPVPPAAVAADVASPETPPTEPPVAVPQVDIDAEVGLPRFWAPIFAPGRKSSWSLTVERITVEPRSEGVVPVPAPMTTTVSFEIACEVATVAPVAEKPSVRAASVTCAGFDDSGIDLGPQGNWFSDGKDLWRAGEVDGERSLELAALPAPRTWQHGEGDDITTVYRVVAGPEPESWCHTEGFVLGDGGEIMTCFDRDRGPYRFQATYAGPTESVKATLILR